MLPGYIMPFRVYHALQGVKCEADYTFLAYLTEIIRKHAPEERYEE